MHNLPVYVNRESQFYANPALKVHALRLRVKEKLMSSIDRVYRQCHECTSDQCLDQSRRELERVKATRSQLEDALDGL